MTARKGSGQVKNLGHKLSDIDTNITKTL